MERTERPLTAKEVSSILNVGDSTLRKWCIAIEEQEYFFSRTDGNKRLFFRRDLDMMKRFRKYVQVQNISIENAVKLVVEEVNEVLRDENEQQNSTNDVLNNRSSNEVIERLLNHIEQQEAFNKELLRRLEEQNTLLLERIEKRDRRLLEGIKEIQEQKKEMLQLAAAKEEESKKGLFARLFGR